MPPIIENADGRRRQTFVHKSCHSQERATHALKRAKNKISRKGRAELNDPF